jgi:hypothetical protein
MTEDTLHELMTLELAVYWSLGIAPRTGPPQTDENYRVPRGAASVFLMHVFPGDADGTIITLRDRRAYVDEYSHKLITLHDTFL